MKNYTANTCVFVYPFIRQSEGEEVVIGRVDTAIFLVLPSDAIELLDDLATGLTVGEVQSLYYHRYNEIPDLEGLLSTLESKGFVYPLVGDKADESFLNYQTIHRKNNTKSTTTHYHFANFPQSLARKLLNYHILLGCGVLIGLALVVVFIKPSLIPGWDTYFFKENLTLTRLTLMLISYLTLFLHEMVHLVAARAVGVSSRMGISNRLWELVAETDMTGIWSIPRNQRYLPFLAGSLLDATSASILFLVFFVQSLGWFTLNPIISQFGRAILLTYLLRLLWQCYLFVRTDFYFVLANFFHCKNLMKDTEVFLVNQISKICRRIHRVNQSYIPVREMQVVRWYALLWILGRIAAFGSLIFISIPLVWRYCLVVFTAFRVGYKTDPYAFVDALLMGLIVLVPRGIGFWLWICSFRTSKR